MNKKVRESSVVFSTRGQVVIPRHIRKELGIEKGTRAIIYQTQEGIVLKPITREYIHSLRGILKSKHCARVATHELIEERTADLRREETKIEKHRS